MKKYFELHGSLSKKDESILWLIGTIILIILWSILSAQVSHAILPSPIEVLISFKELHFDDYLIINVFKSIKLNLLGYIEAIIIAIPLGMLIALIPLFKGLVRKWIDAIRFLPLTAITGLFIAWFGIDTTMKVQFLAFGIIVYLLPVVIVRVDDTDKVLLQTLKTLGATPWQIVKHVYSPFVLSKLSDDIRNLVAISWTYIIVAELINKSGGIGSLIFMSARQSRLDKVFAILIVIILVGFLQDRLFSYIDKKVFKFKHV